MRSAVTGPPGGVVPRTFTLSPNDRSRQRPFLNSVLPWVTTIRPATVTVRLGHSPKSAKTVPSNSTVSRGGAGAGGGAGGGGDGPGGGGVGGPDAPACRAVKACPPADTVPS